MRLNNDNDDLNATGYEYILIGDDRSAEVIDMFRDHYLPDETASRAIGLTLNDELKDIILAQVYFPIFHLFNPNHLVQSRGLTCMHNYGTAHALLCPQL